MDRRVAATLRLWVKSVKEEKGTVPGLLSAKNRPFLFTGRLGEGPRDAGRLGGVTL
jgi:hypothetical protein